MYFASPCRRNNTPVSAGKDVLAYRGGRIGTVQLTWFDREGREPGTLGPPGDYHDLALSPDGEKLVTPDSDSNYLILVDLGTSAFRRSTFKPENVTRSSGSADGRFIAYDSTRTGGFSVFIVPATGVGTEETPLGTEDARNPVFSPDGRLLLYEFSPDGRWVAYTADVSGRAEVYVRAFPSGEGQATALKLFAVNSILSCQLPLLKRAARVASSTGP